MIVFLLFCKILSHYMSLTPSKSIPQKSNHDFKEKYPYVRAVAIKPMCIKDILTKTRDFLPYASVLEYD